MTVVDEKPYDIELAEWLSKKENLPRQMKIQINKETDKAVYVDQLSEDGTTIITTMWLPKSAIKYI